MPNLRPFNVLVEGRERKLKSHPKDLFPRLPYTHTAPTHTTKPFIDVIEGYLRN